MDVRRRPARLWAAYAAVAALLLSGLVSGAASSAAAKPKVHYRETGGVISRRPRRAGCTGLHGQDLTATRSASRPGAERSAMLATESTSPAALRIPYGGRLGERDEGAPTRGGGTASST